MHLNLKDCFTTNTEYIRYIFQFDINNQNLYFNTKYINRAPSNAQRTTMKYRSSNSSSTNTN